MKSSVFAKHLELLIEASEAATGRRNKAARGAVDLLCRAGATQVRALADEFAPANVDDLSPQGPTLGDARTHFEAWTPFIESVSKKSFVDDYASFLKFLSANKDFDARSYIDAVKAQRQQEKLEGTSKLVDRYVDELNDAYKNSNEFEKIICVISKDNRLDKNAIVEIASRFVYRLPKRTSKKAAIEKIRMRHEAYMSSAAKSAATGGRSAA